MKLFAAFTVVIAITSASPQLQFFYHWNKPTTTLTEAGGTISCAEPSSSSGVGTIISLTLYRARDQGDEPYDIVYKISGTVDEIVKEWGPRLEADYRARATVVEDNFEARQANFSIRLSKLRCSESVLYKCEVQGKTSSDSVQENMTVIARPTGLDIAKEYSTRCGPYRDNCYDCLAMAGRGEHVLYTCSVSVSAVNATNYSFKWFKKHMDRIDQTELTQNITHAVPAIINDTECSRRRISSTVRYIPQYDDQNQRVQCQLFSGSSSSNIMSIMLGNGICVSVECPRIPLSLSSPLSLSGCKQYRYRDCAHHRVVCLGEVVRFTCRLAVLADDATKYQFRWYKRNRDSNDYYRGQGEELTENITHEVGNIICKNDEPKRQVSSTIQYVPQDNDRIVEMECRIGGQFGEMREKKISTTMCVLSERKYTTTTRRPGSAARTHRDTHLHLIAVLALSIVGTALSRSIL